MFSNCLCLRFLWIFELKGLLFNHCFLNGWEILNSNLFSKVALSKIWSSTLTNCFCLIDFDLIFYKGCKEYLSGFDSENLAWLNWNFSCLIFLAWSKMSFWNRCCMPCSFHRGLLNLLSIRMGLADFHVWVGS